ncbi:P-loop NTPase fold protein [Magnetospirillum sp. 64-120]|uniref:KAP family P-loop NTPase fold protein n=1 Tax=Magnetospirillum sp. 64-120 TaxID=1895778 RepID=UPI000925D576|nr:P-loop NTPase fold protein [Magnetospirillum sp. 64-120]OJX67228.1 MAG: hypothetical protein BGO92_20475 [Magnetospirillum sp. 64-120]
MRLFPAPPEIDEQTGFDQGDLFGRKEFGDRLTRLVLALEHPAVLLLDAPWGAGKTIFVKMWEGELRKQSVPVIHFDAFASDYMADPFTALAGEVLDLAKRHESDDAKVDSFRAKSLGVLKVIAKHGGRALVKAATYGVIDPGSSDDWKNIEKDMAAAAAEISDKVLLDRLDHHAEEKATFAAFREALKELAISLGPVELAEGERRPPLVFVIDELDRCRPTFALSLLETVKHFFDVDGVVFLLVTNLAQLEKSVEFAYGAGIDARGYLDKFFHLRALLPTRSKKYISGHSGTYARHIAISTGIRNNYLIEAITNIANEMKIDFRTTERLVANIILFETSTNGIMNAFTDVIVGLSLMRIKHPHLYDRARARNLNLE